MSKHFTIYKSREKLKEQWDFLLKRVLTREIKILKSCTKVFGIATILYLLLYFLTSADNYITIKVVLMCMLAIACLGILIFSIIVFLGKHKNRIFIKVLRNSMTPEQLNYKVELDEHIVKIISGIVLKEYSWDDFSAYGINEDNIYVLNKAKPIESLFWSKGEIGDENYSYLMEILKAKSITKTF